MKLFNSLWNWLKKAQISSWKASQEDLHESVKLPGEGRIGSYQPPTSSETFKGIKVTLPWPGDKQ